MLKQVSIVILAATLITGSGAVVHAEVSDSDPSPTSSAGLRAAVETRNGGDRAFASEIPTNRYVYGYAPGGYAYGYVSERKLIRSHKHGQNN